MKGLVIITALLALAFVISGCTLGAECKKPFISSEGKCCLDLDDNGACDENQEEKSTEPNKTEEAKTTVAEKEETPPAEAKEEPAEEIKEEPKEEAAEETEEEKTETNQTKVGPAPAPKNATILSENSTDMERLTATFAQKITGYKYAYKANWHYIRGDKIKIKLRDAVLATDVTVGGTRYLLFYYDNVYLNKKDKTSVGYCEGTSVRLGREQCITLNLEEVPFPLSYETFKTKLPEEWLFEYIGKTPSEAGVNKYYYAGRKITKLVFDDEETGKETRLYFDETIGLPIRVEIAQGERILELYSYEDLSSNTVREEDVTHRKPSDVPSTEAFYSVHSK